MVIKYNFIISLRRALYYKLCGVVTKCYDLYFGSCGHIGVWCLSKCSYDVIMCGGPLGDAPSIGVLCSVYKARCCRSSGLGKKEMSLRHKRTKATQQDLDNHILLCKTNGIDYVPHSSTPQRPKFDPCYLDDYSTKILCLGRVA